MTATLVACASALPATSALLRCSGANAAAVAEQAGLVVPAAWAVREQSWPLAGGRCPCRVAWFPAGRSFTGEATFELTVPGAPDLVELALDRLVAAGAELAGPGAFTRQALANGRLSLDAAEGVLALTHAGDAAAAARALARLSGGLAAELGPVREQLLALRAPVEAGLDFLDEDDVRAYDPPTLQAAIAALIPQVERWQRAAGTQTGQPVVALVGPANAGKSALFARLTGSEALVSPVAGTTRDRLEASWSVAERVVQLVDTAGWLEASIGDELDQAAVASAAAVVAGADLIVACDAPDASLPHDWRARLPGSSAVLVVATKADLAPAGPEATVAVSAASGTGLGAFVAEVGDRLAGQAGGEHRQQRLLTACLQRLRPLLISLPPDELLADDLRLAADHLGELIGITTPDDVLNLVFSRFCIGK